MAGKGDGEGEGNVLKLENQISVIKYVMLFTNVLEWVKFLLAIELLFTFRVPLEKLQCKIELFYIQTFCLISVINIIGAAVFALCLWLRFEPGINEWLTILNATQFYIGIYILIIVAVIVMVVAFLGCLSALQENSLILLVYIGTQVFAFIVLLAGSAVLLDNSARDSNFQPRIRESMRQLIMNAQYDEVRNTLAMIQEGIACCGADGPDDYLVLGQPLPTECRDTVTGNPFFHGCVDELTWFFEAKCAWIAALAMLVAFISVMNVVLSIILTQALRKEEEEADNYNK